MSNFYYAVQLEHGEPTIYLDTEIQVFDLLKKNKFVTVLRYNDKKTGTAYAKEAALQELTEEEQAAAPIFAITTLSNEGVFVESEELWISNYMFDEFYNPERMPYIEKIIKHSDESCCENEAEQVVAKVTKARIKPEVRKQIIADYKTKKYSYAALGAKYGISATSIGRIVNPAYYEREKEKNKIRGQSYKQPQAKFAVSVKFYEQDQVLIDKVKSVDNKQQYIKNLINDDIKKNS